MHVKAKASRGRRDALKLFGGLGLALSGCSSEGASSSDTSAGAAGSTSGGTGSGGAAGSAGSAGAQATGGASSNTNCAEIPDETAGPYPDKTNMLENQAFYRQDVSEGKTGVPLELTLSVVNAGLGCAGVAGAVVEIWHCDKDGVYSEYSGQPGVSVDESSTTFLRGLQTADENGVVTFKTIYPGWYAGRATHIHIEVYLDGASTPSKTTQLAFPADVNALVYASPLYAAKGQNPTVNANDMVFGDGDTYELATLTGDVESGYAASLTVGI